MDFLQVLSDMTLQTLRAGITSGAFLPLFGALILGVSVSLTAYFIRGCFSWVR